MGWPWSSSGSKAQDHEHLESDSTLQDRLRAPNAVLAQASTAAPPLSRDEAAEGELRALIETFESEGSPPQRPSSSKLPSSTPLSQTPSFSSSSSSSSTFKSPSSLPEIPPAATPINPTLLFPTTMSCRAAFDAAFYCQSLGGQFNSIYRSGTLRSCSPLWSEFWFCMRTNRISLLGEEERKEKVREWYEDRERDKYGVGKVSSEDVWGKRDITVREAFEGDFEGVEGGVAMLRDRGGVDGLGEGV